VADPPLTIRPETPADFANIAAIHARAFGSRSNEAVIVALLRQRRAYDPSLALVAEQDGRIAGHAMFTSYSLRLMGGSVKAVNLAPLAVDPPCQNRGIGAALIEAGHTAARIRGHVLSFLLGHPGYYPRFGYRTRAFGESSVSFRIGGEPPQDIQIRPPLEADVPGLRRVWELEEGGVDFSIEPGTDLLDWVSMIPSFEAKVYLRGRELIGYTRGPKAEPRHLSMFLARDGDSALAMLRMLGTHAHYVLQLHPSSGSTGVFGSPSTGAWEAAMACPLAPSPFDKYYAQVQAGKRPPGRVIWPPAFEVD